MIEPAETSGIAERRAIVLHGLFAALSIAVLAVPGPPVTGVKIAALVLFYNALIPLAGWRLGHREWVRLWLFLVPLSALQIFPDAFLSARLGVLVFPDVGGWRLGTVPAYMAGMWTIALFPVIYAGTRLAARGGRRRSRLTVALASLAVFGGSEAFAWRIPIWYARDVLAVTHVALYLVIPEVLLGLATFRAYEASASRPLAWRLSAAWVLMVFYLGALCFFYLLIEVLMRGVTS